MISVLLSFTEDCCLPAFGNLTELELVFCDGDYWKFLAVLLQKAPNLEYLDLEDVSKDLCKAYDSHRVPKCSS